MTDTSAPPPRPPSLTRNALLRRLSDVVAADAPTQARLDDFVTTLAEGMGADVCSIYLRRAGGQLELCATEGLRSDAVHRTRMAPSQGLVGRVAATAFPVNVANAPDHPAFSYLPEVGEDDLVSFFGAPVLRGGRPLGVLTVQNRSARQYDAGERETLQTAAMVLGEGLGDAVPQPDADTDTSFAGIEVRPSRPERLVGRSIVDGIALGPAYKLTPHVPAAKLIADDPEHEAERLDAAVGELRAHVDALVEGRWDALERQTRQVLDTYRMIAHDRGWLDRLKEAAGSGLTAEGAVERVRNEHRAKLLAAPDPYMRERLHDLEDLANRLLAHLATPIGAAASAPPPPEGAIVVARDVSPAQLLELQAQGAAGVALEEGALTSHAAIVARAFGLAMVGRVTGLLDRVEDGDAVVVDGARAHVHLRPAESVIAEYEAALQRTGERRAALEALRDTPAVTKDGQRVHLLANAGLRVDLARLEASGADGIGLFRTEFQFMVASSLPRQDQQTALYKAALDAAKDRPVTFRTLDLGGDKLLPYASADEEENPAMGWRAIRMGLDRPGLMRYQLRALIRAAEGRDLRVMFPLIATPAEFRDARALLERELEWSQTRGRPAPERVAVGAMVETPAIALHLDGLLPLADFVSIGVNDLAQFLFAADRGNARVAERYDVLSAPMLRMLDAIWRSCAEADTPVTVCGEIAGRPLEAFTLLALGYRDLSMAARSIGAVKRLVLDLDADAAAEAVLPLLADPPDDMRAALRQAAEAVGVSL